MDITTIKNDLISILEDTFNVSSEQIIQTESLRNIIAQSLEMIELLCSIEDHFKIEIPDEDIEKLMKLDDAVQYIYELTSSNSQ